MTVDSITDRVAALSAPEKERLIQAVMESLLAQAGDLVVSDEGAARELLADVVSEPEHQVNADQVLRPSVGLENYVDATLALLAADPDVGPVVERELDALRPQSQMLVDPVTAAVVLGALVVFLQTKFEARVSRKDGKTSFQLAVRREAASDEIVGKVIDAVRKVILR